MHIKYTPLDHRKKHLTRLERTSSKLTKEYTILEFRLKTWLNPTKLACEESSNFISSIKSYL